MTTYLVELSFKDWASIHIDADWYAHGDLVTMGGKYEYVCWDPWYNRVFRWLFGGFYKKLKMKK